MTGAQAARARWHDVSAVDRLRNKSDFQRVYETGRRVSTRHAVVIAAPGAADRSRIGIIAGKRVGKAHDRVRAKRRLREVWRRLEPKLGEPLDVLIIARPTAVSAPFDELCAAAEIGVRRSRAGQTTRRRGGSR